MACRSRRWRSRPGGPRCPGLASGPGGLLAQTRWAGPVADAGDLFDELGTQGSLRGFFALHGSLA